MCNVRKTITEILKFYKCHIYMTKNISNRKKKTKMTKI